MLTVMQEKTQSQESGYFELGVKLIKRVLSDDPETGVKTLTESFFISIVDTSRPYMGRVKEALAQWLNDGWEVSDLWAPEPTDDMDEPIHIRKAA